MEQESRYRVTFLLSFSLFTLGYKTNSREGEGEDEGEGEGEGAVNEGT